MLVIGLGCQASAQEEGWWSLEPLDEPVVPADTGWGLNEVDAFVHRGLLQAGLGPSDEADRQTLIRRLTFDLWGLPPDPKDVEAFLGDTEAGAYERLVDRLLASPRHAERQARHWLDVARYADTHGFDKDKRRPNAWPYRDWVVSAFHDDIPWSEFVRLQVAGDIIDPGGPGVAAAGFLAAGPWDYVGHVELREGTLDKQITRNLDRDEFVRGTFEAFTSTTVGCARCHDHKFDPVSIEAYYQLQALLAGFERADCSFDREPGRAELRRELTADLSLAQAAEARHSAELAGRSTPQLDALTQAIFELPRFRLPPVLQAETGRALGFHSAISASADVEKWVQVDLGEARSVDTISLWPASEVFGEWDGAGFGFPPRLSVLGGMEADLSDGRVLFALTAGDLPNPGGAPLVIGLDPVACRYVRVVAHRLWARKHGDVDYCFALAELSVHSNGEHVAIGRAVTSLDSIEAGDTWGRHLLTDGVLGNSTLEHLEAADDGVILAASRRLLDTVGLVEEQASQRLALSSAGDRARSEALARTAHALAEELSAMGAPDAVYAASRSFPSEGSFTQPEGPRVVHVLKRGEVHTPGTAVSPGAPSLGNLAGFTLPQGAGDAVRRRALGDWLTDPDHPLTWRSAANRLWQWRFRRGLVATPSDFGRMGDGPSHPDLLDWLACRLRSGELSARGLTRLLVTSATYRQGSLDSAAGVEVDSDNRLLWRGPRGRLDAESIHDALLSIGGELDLTMGGPGYDRFTFEDDHSPRYLYGGSGVEAKGRNRRALYRFIVRSVPDPWLSTFDCPDPSQAAPLRAETTSPLQALALFNSPFALARAEALARQGGDAAGAWRLAMGRAPTPKEEAYLEAHQAERGLLATCRVIVNSPGFLYLD